MKIKRLKIKDFGPFSSYEINFLPERDVCVLLTGKNNEGKSSIINALRLLNYATRVLGKRKQEIDIDGNFYYKFLQQDTENLLIGRMIHNYGKTIARITGEFDDGLEINVYLSPEEDLIYTDANWAKVPNLENTFGFMPALGPLSEDEDIISKISWLKFCLDTSLAPRHLRNHLLQTLSGNQLRLAREIIKKSWKGVELAECERDESRNRIQAYYKEDNIKREISWAGQGLQVWFQIVVHFVRLLDSSIIVLDEPEINLHPEKQNELIRILREYYHGSIIIATHSVELMNNVSVSHIINVQKKNSRPKIKLASDRQFLNIVRSQIGSNFNLVASQFEDFDLILFTEDTYDYGVIQDIASVVGLRVKSFNIPMHGASEYKKAGLYKTAYKLLIGKDIKCTLLLDRDYFPKEYRNSVMREMAKDEVKVVYTPGKEIENIFLSPEVLDLVVSEDKREKFANYWEKVYSELKVDCFGDYLSHHKHFGDSKLDIKTITKTYAPVFEKIWADKSRRHTLIDGKKALSRLRSFYRAEYGRNLTQSLLSEKLGGREDTKTFLKSLYQMG